jgi:hypothetical protein
MNFNKFLNEKYTKDDINTAYGFYGSMEDNHNEKIADEIFDAAVKDLMKEFGLKDTEAVALLNSKAGRQAADAIIAGESEDSVVAGMYWYFGKNNKSKIIAAAKKAVNESEELDEASNFGAPASLTKAQTKKVAETLAKAMSKAEGAKVTVNLKTLEEDSFDLDYDGEEYDGGSYNIYDDGSVVNHAVTPNEIYGKMDSSVEDFIKGLKKPIKESEEISESESYSNAFASWFTGTSLNSVKHPKYGNHKVTPDQIKNAPADYKNKLFKAIENAVKSGDITDDMIKANESEVFEAVFGSKDFDKTLVTYAIDKKANEIYVISVDKVIHSSFPDVSKVEDKRFHIMFGMMLDQDWLKQYDKLPKVGDILPAPKKDKAFETFEVNESKITLKRQYTENYPAKTAGKHAAIRNKIIEALKDGELTKEEFDTLVSGLTEDSKRWLRRNSTFFNIQEDKVGLTKTGQRIAATLYQNDYKLKTNENNNMENKFIYESFSEFVDSINESFELVTESFKSSMLAGLFTRQGTFDAPLAKAFYGATKLKLDQIEDEDLLTTSPALAYKNKQNDSIIFYISDTEKSNPYAPSDAYYTSKTIPGEGYLLAVASGDNKFYDNAWTGGRWDRNAKNRTLKQVDNNPSDSIGINKKYSGWDATGLYNVKRISEVADRAIVINIALLRQKYSAEAERAERAAAKKGAIAFKSDKDFKAENMARYNQIIAKKATQMPMDSLVAKAIETMSNQIKDGLTKQTKGRYGEIIVGTNAKGAEAKLSDVANHMQRILDDYSGYVRVVAQQEDSVAKYGEAESWYKREVEQKAKELKDRLDKIESFSYIW